MAFACIVAIIACDNRVQELCVGMLLSLVQLIHFFTVKANFNYSMHYLITKLHFGMAISTGIVQVTVQNYSSYHLDLLS